MQLYALIMAGGEGKRFWPLSKRDRPKQFLKLIGGNSFIRQTVDRILPLIPIEKIFIVTVERYVEETRRHIPELPMQNIIIEPVGKNTAPCIALGTLRISKDNPKSTLLVLPSDHAIGDESEFRKTILYSRDLANTKLPSGEYPLVTLGIRPTKPETGYGYIKESSEIIHSSNKFVGKRVSKFIEKPASSAAEGFINEGGYYWNSGIFVWKSSTIIKEYSEILPGWYKYFTGISKAIENPGDNIALMKFYNNIEGGSIDKLILEKSKNSVVIPTDFSWSDIGDWNALDEFLRSNDSENINIGNCISIDSSSALFYAEKRLIAAVGVKDLVVVETDDAILVLDKSKSQDVKKIVENLEDLEDKEANK